MKKYNIIIIFCVCAHLFIKNLNASDSLARQPSLPKNATVFLDGTNVTIGIQKQSDTITLTATPQPGSTSEFVFNESALDSGNYPLLKISEGNKSNLYKVAIEHAEQGIKISFCKMHSEDPFSYVSLNCPDLINSESPSFVDNGRLKIPKKT